MKDLYNALNRVTKRFLKEDIGIKPSGHTVDIFVGYQNLDGEPDYSSSGAVAHVSHDNFIFYGDVVKFVELATKKASELSTKIGDVTLTGYKGGPEVLVMAELIDPKGLEDDPDFDQDGIESGGYS